MGYYSVELNSQAITKELCMRFVLFFTLLPCSMGVFATESILATGPQGLMLAKALYPEAAISQNEDTPWSLEVRSEARITGLDGSEYVAMTWNENNHPGVGTNYEYYNYGGLAVFYKGVLIDSTLSDNMYVKEIVQGKKNTYILTKTGSAYHGNSSAYFEIFRLGKDGLTGVFNMEIAEDTTNAGGSVYTQSEMIRTDLNGDEISDLIVRVKSYKVVDMEPVMDASTVLEEKSFIFE